LAAATGFLAKHGLLISHGHSLEALAHVTDVVFDKTGTLTTGQFAVNQILLVGNHTEEEALAYAAAMEQFSEHPLAQALVSSQFIDVNIAPTNVQNTAGFGLQAQIDGVNWAIGRPVWVAELFTHSVHTDLQAAAGSWVALGNQHGMVAYFCLEDQLKADSHELVQQLQHAGLNIHLLSGDSAGAVNRVAQELSIACLQAEATPESKLTYVQNLQHQAKVVLMVGDGINDAPVLVQADVSIAVDGGADVAQAGSDLVMIKSDMSLVALALKQGQKTKRIIQENLLWAIAYNAVAVPIAMAGYANPWIAALGMAVSSLLVTLNAMRLLR
jgi:Cu2+-exporting ATPase